MASISVNGKEPAAEAAVLELADRLGRALDAASAWVVGLRADQSGQRSSLAPASWDSAHALI